MSDGYLGPAGIFSTDDPGADQRQIEAEQFDDQEGYDNFGEPETLHYPPDLIEVYAGCSQGAWHHLDTIDGRDFETFKERMQEDHNGNCSCGKLQNLEVIKY